MSIEREQELVERVRRLESTMMILLGALTLHIGEKATQLLLDEMTGEAQ